jgi:hypothetical protein
MTIREIPIEALFGDVVEAQQLWLVDDPAGEAPPETLIKFRSGRWLLCNLNTGTLKAYERHERATESI